MITINGTVLPVTLFPDNTSQVWKLPQEILESKVVEVKWHFTHEGEFMAIAQLSDLLSYYNVPHTLYMSYLPYGRQDKDISNQTTFGLTTFARLLNNLYFECITILDPHSEEALHQINWAYAVYPHSQLANCIMNTNATLVCYPDAGAVRKYASVYKNEVGSAFVVGNKVRNQSTGEITKYEVLGDVFGENILIVDDICDGGATFALLSKQLYDLGANEVNLFVSHGIFSKGFKPLFAAGIKKIFTPDGEMSENQYGFEYRRI